VALQKLDGDKVSDNRREALKNVLTPALMSSDDEASDGGFITHQQHRNNFMYSKYFF
jgi:hypothetical protein